MEVKNTIRDKHIMSKEEAEFEEQEILAEQERLQQADEDYRKAMDDLHYAEVEEQEREWRQSQISY